MEEKVQGKPVQEILIDNNDEIPERYVYKNGYPQCKKESVPYMDEFFIDFSLVTSSSPQGNQELEKLLLALNQWGCFQAVNHGMAEEYLNKIRQLGRQFFALPLEEKQKYSREIGGFDGYGTDAFFSDQQSLGNDTVSSDQKITLDWLDRLYLTVYPEHKRKFKFWPEMPLEFREILHEYTLKVKEVRDQFLKAVARSLELEENRFLKEQGDFVKMSARFNLYPPCSTPENVLGFKPHSDIGTLTVILQDNEVEGLQVLKDEKWFKVPTYPDALFINVVIR